MQVKLAVADVEPSCLKTVDYKVLAEHKHCYDDRLKSHQEKEGTGSCRTRGTARRSLVAIPMRKRNMPMEGGKFSLLHQARSDSRSRLHNCVFCVS